MSSAPVLVATDLGAAADEALRQAHLRAERGRAALVVCHVVPNFLRDDPVFRPRGSETLRSLTEVHDHIAGEIRERVTGVTGRTADGFTLALDEGVPDTVIVEKAEEMGAGLVVLGAGNRAGGGLGKIGQRIIRHAHAPVLIARPPVPDGPVLVATDFSDPSLPAVAAAADEARSGARALAILHSIELWPALAAVPAGPIEAPVVLPESQLAEYRQTIDARLAEALATHRAAGDRIVVEGPAEVTILEAARQRGADLVVLGTVGKSGLRRLLLGSVAERVAQTAPCSVLIVRLHRP
jgi:nucleotide-binding universal stress UspA family protein